MLDLANEKGQQKRKRWGQEIEKEPRTQKKVIGLGLKNQTKREDGEKAYHKCMKCKRNGIKK